VTVVLSGRRDGSTHREVAALASLPPELRLIGGLAVMCRVGTPHRATVDLDAVARDLPGVHSALARLATWEEGEDESQQVTRSPRTFPRPKLVGCAAFPIMKFAPFLLVVWTLPSFGVTGCTALPLLCPSPS